jgi:apolipoprotein N-acyltransferase
VFVGSVISGEWQTFDDVRVCGVLKTVVVFVSFVELVPIVDGVNAVCVTDVVLLSDIYVAASDGVTAVWVTTFVLVSDGYAVVDVLVVGVIVVFVIVGLVANDSCVAVDAE